MKILLTLLLMLSLSDASKLDKFASDFNYSRDYSSALKTAKKQDKLIMLVLVSRSCPWCEEFEKNTLSSSFIGAKVDASLVPLIMNNTLDASRYPKKFYSKQVPSIAFINPKTQTVVYETLGYMNKKTFSQEIDIALEKYAKK
ncbi:MAG: thioredoxin family protein [Sulfurimonas sp.]|nr:thioredoxin family protein [Sulfurimonas sp.]